MNPQKKKCLDIFKKMLLKGNMKEKKTAKLVFPCFYPFSLAAEAERADAPRLLRRCVDLAEARLLLRATVPEQQHVGQMGDVAGGQPQSFDLGKLPVHGLGGDESPEGCEGRVDALGPASLPGVRCAPLLHHHRRLPLQRAWKPPPLLAGAAVTLLRAAVALAAVLVVLRRDREVRVDQVCRHRPEHGESHHGDVA